MENGLKHETVNKHWKPSPDYYYYYYYQHLYDNSVRTGSEKIQQLIFPNVNVKQHKEFFC